MKNGKYSGLAKAFSGIISSSAQIYLNKKYKELRNKIARQKGGYARWGYELPPLPPIPKKITEGSIRTLERYERRMEKEVEKQKRKKERERKKQADKEYKERKKWEREEKRARKELDLLLDLIEEGLYYSGNKAASNYAIQRASDYVNEIFDNAMSKLSAQEIMKRLKEHYGDNLKLLVNMVEKLIYAVYNLHGSGFAKWAGAGARDRWMAELKRLASILDVSEEFTGFVSMGW